MHFIRKVIYFITVCYPIGISLSEGECVVTSGCKSHIHFLLFCFGPTLGKALTNLASTITNLLSTADTHLQSVSIALPLIGAGN